jgi:tRNA-2-methylthio-N6-dimethylallyladenosine synthase
VVNFKGAPRLIGQLVNVRITEAMHYSLRGEVTLREDALPV